MISVRGQYYLSMDVGDSVDFIAEDDLEMLTLIEEAGNILPTFNAVFLIHDDRILKKFQETQKLTLQLGRETGSPLTVKLVITRLDTEPVGSGKRRVAISAVLDALGYVREAEAKLYVKKTGLDVIKSVAGQYFSVEMLGSSEGSMTWVNPGYTARKFVTEVWLRTKCSSFPVIGIDSSGKFRCGNFGEFRNKVKWNFSPKENPGMGLVNGGEGYREVTKEPGSKYIVVDAAPVLENHEGFMNSWFALGRDCNEMDADTGEIKILTQGPLSMLGKKAEATSSLLYTMGIKSENVHDTYNKAFLTNMTGLVGLSKTKVRLSFAGVYEEIRVLDMANFTEIKLFGSGTSETISGSYMVSKVIRNISAKTLSTSVELVRDGLPQ